jgi:hypothetical protein
MDERVKCKVISCKNWDWLGEYLTVLRIRKDFLNQNKGRKH